MRPPALAAYGAVTRALQPFAPALLRRRAARDKEDAARLHERLGRPILPRPPGPLAWLHGASVGESLSLLPAIDRLRAERPDLTLLITSVTLTSAELLARRLPSGVLHQFAPLDTPAAASGFLAHWRPELAVFVESELWPNLLLAAKAQGARLALISARVSASSARGWARAPASASALLQAFDLVLTQDDLTATRLEHLGGRVDGRLDLKRFGQPLPVDEGALAAARTAAAGRPVLLAASTHGLEEGYVLEAFDLVKADPRRPILVLAPRHPARGPEIHAYAVREFGPATLASAGHAFGAEAVHVADTLGELGLWMRLASGVLVGGALDSNAGGHNPLEPARLDCPVASGPDVDNWRSVYADLDAAGGMTWVEDADQLAAFWVQAIDPAEPLRRQAERARAVAEQGTTALDPAVSRLLALLP